jgi:hypothetical protein
VIIGADPDRVESDLAAGLLTCPRCGGRLRPWAHAATRRVRQLDGSTQARRPRRAPARKNARPESYTGPRAAR